MSPRTMDQKKEGITEPRQLFRFLQTLQIASYVSHIYTLQLRGQNVRRLVHCDQIHP